MEKEPRKARVLSWVGSVSGSMMQNPSTTMTESRLWRKGMPDRLPRSVKLSAATLRQIAWVMDFFIYTYELCVHIHDQIKIKQI